MNRIQRRQKAKAAKKLGKKANQYAILGEQLAHQGKFDEAVEAFHRALKKEPENPLIFYSMGMALKRLRRDAEALEMFQKSMELDPRQPKFYTEFATVLRTMDNLDGAEKFTRAALAEFPNDPLLMTELATNMQYQYNFNESEELARKVLVDSPDFVLALICLAVVLLQTGEQEEIIEIYNKIFELLPNEPSVHFNYALTLFSFGHLEEAWKHYRSRWDAIGFSSPVRGFPQKLYDGSPLKGKSILIYGEQGLGDEIRYSSLIPDMMSKGAEVSIECNPRLVNLFKRSFEGANVFPAPYSEAEAGDVDLDFQSPILDLGEFLRPNVDSFPSDPDATYLKANPKRIAFWGDRMKALGPRPKVGLIWRSVQAFGNKNIWGATVEELAPILSIEGIDFVNLMYVECKDDRAKIHELYGVNLHTWDDINLKDDQDDLSALVSNLDLVISYQSAVSFLAGAMAIPVWTFVPVMVNFEFLGNPEAPGWAPSMRYFRKKVQEEWDETFELMAVEIKSKFGL
jgi:tetratricopeptide (TPR) repeat protein